jgi:hypothetical protein
VGRIDATSLSLAGVPVIDRSLATVDGVDALVPRFPREDVLAAAREIATSDPGLVPDDLVRGLLGGTGSLSTAQVDVMDRQGNDNGRLDVGDIRAYLTSTGSLPTPGSTVVAPTAAPSTTPVMLLLTGVMDDDQRAYAMDILLLTAEGR